MKCLSMIHVAIIIIMITNRNIVGWMLPTISPKILYRSTYHSSVTCQLNRFLFDETEIINLEGSMNASVTIPIDDYRTIHAAKILSLQNGDIIRCGIVSQSNNHGGLITDEASIQWIPEGKVKKAEPLKNGSPPGWPGNAGPA